MRTLMHTRKGSWTRNPFCAFLGYSYNILSLPAEKAVPYYSFGSDPEIQKRLIQSAEIEVRSNGRKIVHIIESLAKTEAFDQNGPGGRHDNDFEDIHQISILPTPDEIASTEAPFLRQAQEIEECPESERLGRHTDNQFRLLREDMLKSLREEVQIATGVKAGRLRGLRVNNLVMEGVQCDDRLGWTMRLECLGGLPQIPRGKFEERSKFISDNRNFLRHLSPACLIADGQLLALANIVRNQDLLAQDPSVLCLQFSGPEDATSKAILALKMAKSVDLVQVNTAIFAYEPVLKQLQGTSRLLLKEEILDWSEERQIQKHKMSQSPSVSALVSSLRSNPYCDLQDVLELPNPTTLDPSQKACFLASMEQRLSVVQGPPGNNHSIDHQHC